MPHPFQVGDTVVCIDDSVGYTGTRYLTRGKKYTVTHARGSYPDYGVVLAGIPGRYQWYKATRFTHYTPHLYRRPICLSYQAS